MSKACQAREYRRTYLLILNDAPYGSERSYNALLLGLSLRRREGVTLKMFLLGDAVSPIFLPLDISALCDYNICVFSLFLKYERNEGGLSSLARSGVSKSIV